MRAWRKRIIYFCAVDEQRWMRGVVKVGLLTQELTAEAGDVEECRQADDLFENIVVRIAELRNAPPGRSLRYRFSWLLASSAADTAGSFLARAYETTLAQSQVLVFFLTLVLSLGECVSAIHGRRHSGTARELSVCGAW